MYKVLIVCFCFCLTGCGLLKSERQHIVVPEPRLDSEQLEIMQQQAKSNYDLAKWVRENSLKPNDERIILLEDGSKIIVKFFGDPIEDIDGTNVKTSKRIQNKSKDVVDDYKRDLSEYRDDIYNDREDSIRSTNLKWDLGKILGFFSGSTVLLIIGAIVLSIFFPVIIPIFSILFQLLRGGMSAFSIFAKLGVTGIKNVISAVESFRDNMANTDAKKVFDEHMSKALDQKDKDALDKFKNHFHI